MLLSCTKTYKVRGGQNRKTRMQILYNKIEKSDLLVFLKWEGPFNLKDRRKEGEEHVYLFSLESEFYFTRYKNQIFEELRKMD